jgi:hypothetical protein
MDKALYDIMQARMETAKGKRMMKLRQSTVEPVLGTLVNFLGMKRLNTIGIEQACKCMLAAASAYNLKKLLKFCVNKVEAAIKTIEKCMDIDYKRSFLITLRLRSIARANN